MNRDLSTVDLCRELAGFRTGGSDLQEAVVDAAADHYLGAHPGALLRDFTYHGARFLVDTTGGLDRTVLAVAPPASPGQAREETYQRGFPIPETCAGRRLDRGHFLPYSAGGGYGPNLFPQDRALNRGWSSAGRRYRAMETRALSAPDGTLFAALPIYADESTLPAFVQLSIVGSQGCESEVFRNRFDDVEDEGRLDAELDGATDAQLGALGEEAAAALLEENFEAIIVALGDAGMPRDEGRQDLDVVAIVDGELVAFEVKTLYRSRRAEPGA